MTINITNEPNEKSVAELIQEMRECDKVKEKTSRERYLEHYSTMYFTMKR